MKGELTEPANPVPVPVLSPCPVTSRTHQLTRRLSPNALSVQIVSSEIDDGRRKALTIEDRIDNDSHADALTGAHHTGKGRSIAVLA